MKSTGELSQPIPEPFFLRYHQHTNATSSCGTSYPRMLIRGCSLSSSSLVLKGLFFLATEHSKIVILTDRVWTGPLPRRRAPWPPRMARGIPPRFPPSGSRPGVTVREASLLLLETPRNALPRPRQRQRRQRPCPRPRPRPRGPGSARVSPSFLFPSPTWVLRTDRERLADSQTLIGANAHVRRRRLARWRRLRALYHYVPDQHFHGTHPTRTADGPSERTATLNCSR